MRAVTRADAGRVAMVVVMAGMAAGLSSCISAVERDYVTYDAGKDEFRMLMVLRGIQAKDSEDVAYLKALYANRDHWITPAVPGGYVAGLLADSLIRMGDHDFSVLNMYASRPTNVDKTTTGVDLSQVEVVPGEFFVEAGGQGGAGADGKPALGYYQALRVPGKVVDGALAELSAAAQSGDLTKGIDEELLRRKDGGKVYTWADLRAQTLKDITLEDAASQPADAAGGAAGAEGATTQGGGPEAINPLMVMEEGSLKQMMGALADRSLKLAREKTVVSLAVPMSAKDAAGFKGLLEACVSRAREVSAGAKETEENAEKLYQMRALAVVGGQLKLEAGAGGGLKTSVDVVGLVDAVGQLPERRVDLNQKNGQEGELVDVVAALKESGVPVDEKLTAAEVVKEFDAGTLKGHAPEKSVVPGEGIVGKE
ncbi:MAG TPA: hypothetical protein VH253_02015 [Phycisphaerae bacterium]|nr:hypothetical protein [Phycisphaerae bacterium]